MNVSRSNNGEHGWSSSVGVVVLGSWLSARNDRADVTDEVEDENEDEDTDDRTTQ